MKPTDPELTHQQKIEWVNTIRRDPKVFYEKILKVKHWWPGMDQMLQAIATHKRVAVGSGHALSKDFIGGGLPLWFLSAFYPAKVIMTCPSDRQIDAIMWAELTSHYKQAGPEAIGGQLYARKFVIQDENWFAIAFTTKETKGQVGKFQGFHSPNVLVIVSEAQAVDDSIFEQIEGSVLTSDNARIILLGNPLRNSGYFAKALRSKDYFSLNLSCLDSPNVKEGREIIPGLATRQFVEKMKTRYGESSPVYQARVLGQIPDSPINTVFAADTVRRAYGATLILPATKRRKGLVIDPATFGDDECHFKIFEEGKEIYKEGTSGVLRTTEIAGRAIVLAEKYDVDAIVVDSIGEGRGVADMLYAADLRKQGVNIIEYKGSHESTDKTYLNCRTASAFTARKWFERGHVSLLEDEILLEELVDQHYFVNNRGMLQLEDKDDIKERLGRSPNRADCVFMWFWCIDQIIPKKRKDAYGDDYRPAVQHRLSAMAA